MPDTASPRGIDLQDQPGHLIRRAHQIAIAAFHDQVGRKVTPIQYAVRRPKSRTNVLDGLMERRPAAAKEYFARHQGELRILQDKPGIDQVTLAREAALDTSTTADIAARLDAKGWITRQVLARGQRSLSLTPAGAEVLASLVPGIQSVQHQLLGRLEAPERAELLRLLRKFAGEEPFRPAAGQG